MPPEVIRARKLRREMSYPEVLLWQRLRGAPEGVRFRRQHPIGADYTADFYCAAARLVIEVDGEIHSHGKAPTRDAVRDEYMRGRGLAVVRLTASEVLRDADEAPAAILRLVAAPLHHPPSPRATAGGPPPQRAGEDL
jgi:very-short-patch-repair endonuclease